MTYAGFWKRFLASLIDGVILLCMALVCSIPIAMIVFDNIERMFLIGYVLAIPLQWIYFIVLESSSRQATLGKAVLGIKVVDLNGNRISPARSAGRNFGKFISGFIVNVGFIMIAITKKKHGLHDVMAKCLVINNRAE